MATVRQLGERLQNTVERYRADLGNIESDPRLSELRDDIRRARTEQQRQALRQEVGARVSSAIKELIGTDDDPDSGRLWQEEAAAKAALREAKTASTPDVDWRRVQTEGQRFASVLTTKQNLSEVQDWYEQQDGHVRMAVQTVGPQMLRQSPQLSGDGGLGGFLGQLERDYEDTMTTPEVAAAAAKAEATIGAGVDAVRSAQRAVDTLSLGVFAPEARLLRRVAIFTKVDSAKGGEIREWFSRVGSPAVVMPAEFASVDDGNC